ncbi:CG11255 [Drosophila busckii]|uniref:Adenosine kinase n=1 Tax=Drosophila busckii TaxID=30019 RepID=A0A0M3QWK5_DROBS|nr:CG11255 [Drosophila busckii]
MVIMKCIRCLIHVVLCVLLSKVTYSSGQTPGRRSRYEPNWASLDQRPLPRWYDEAKVGIFLHYGVYSVPSFGSEWFWTNWKNLRNPDYIRFMQRNYKPDFTYQQFAGDFTAELFNATQWALLFRDSGASAPFISQVFMAPLLDVMPYVDIIFGNEAEAHAFATAQGWPTDDLREIGKRLVALKKLNTERPRIAILTQGCDPVLLIQHDSIQEFPVKMLAVHEIVDTNGAGDAFVGGFLSQYVQGKSMDVCIRCGNYAAGHIIKNPGCTYSGASEFVE